MSDAITIARWCWPDENWHLCGDEPRTQREIAFVESEHDNADGCYAVEDAESVLIERGHAEAYGRAIHSVVVCGLDLPTIGPGIIPDITVGEIAQIATAPLAARIRAMAAVIRTLEPE